MGIHKGHYGKYTGNAKWSMDHAHTKVTKENYKATERDDAAHIDYLKRDVLYDDHHGHSDEKMTADEKHISKLAGDMKYDKRHHSPAKMTSEDGKKKNKFQKDIEQNKNLVDNPFYGDGTYQGFTLDKNARESKQIPRSIVENIYKRVHDRDRKKGKH